MLTGKTILITGAAGLLGSQVTASILAQGAKVIAVTSSPEKSALASQLGADVVVDALSQNLAADMLAANGGKPVDLVLEMVKMPLAGFFCASSMARNQW